MLINEKSAAAFVCRNTICNKLIKKGEQGNNNAL